MAAAQPTERVSLANFKNIAMSEPNGALVKTSGGGSYNATATSPDFISCADCKRRGISWRVSQDFVSPWRIGLVSAPNGQQQQQKAIAESVDSQFLTYAACVGYDRGFYVFESGKQCGHFGSVQIGDCIKIELNSEKPPSIEYRVNGKLKYKSKMPIVFPLFPKICAYYEGLLAEELRWIVDPARTTAEPEACIAELQTQLRKSEEEKQDLRTLTEAKQAENEALKAVVEQQKLEMKAASDTLHAITKENAQLQVQLEAERVASRTCAEEKAGMHAAQALAEQLQKELKAEHEARLAVTKEKAELQMQLEVEKAASRANAQTKAEAEAAQALAEQLQQELKAESDARLAVLEEQAKLEKLEMQLEAERAAVAEKKAPAEQLQKELKAESEVRLAALEEKAKLQMQLEAERAASQAAAEKKEQQLEAEKAASCAVADEMSQLQIRTVRLQRENQAFQKAVEELADENVRLQVDKKQIQAEMQELRRQLLRSNEASSEAWEDVGSGATASSAEG